ncbi:unnamed protein product [Cuscuta epithymum]|uniref:Uncharacterized protein n=1 Tax=Cuscuta epithymum TaxID=186058 RepID=A0AAV0FPN9_9ASTE|nr:unnamed protein product [Cuscuta epithymum]
MAFHSLHDSYCCIVVPSHPRRVTRLTPPARTTLVSQPSCHLAPQPGKVSPCPCLEKRPPPPPRKVFASYTLSLLFQDFQVNINVNIQTVLHKFDPHFYSSQLTIPLLEICRWTCKE